MLIQKELEKKVVDLLVAALSEKGISNSCRVCGSWQPVADGIVRWVDEDTSHPAAINVAVGTPGRETFSNPSAEFAAKITLNVRFERDPTGTLLVNICDVVQATIDAWQAEAYQASFTRFDLPTLSVDDLAVQPGSSPAIVGDRVVISWPLTFSGSFLN